MHPHDDGQNLIGPKVGRPRDGQAQAVFIKAKRLEQAAHHLLHAWVGQLRASGRRGRSVDGFGSIRFGLGWAKPGGSGVADARGAQHRPIGPADDGAGWGVEVGGGGGGRQGWVGGDEGTDNAY